MTARGYRVILTSSLHNLGDRPAIDLKIENYVPSEVWYLMTIKRPPGGAPVRDYANENKNQTECIGGGVS